MDMVIKFLVAAVGAGTPLLFGTVGEILTEKTGHLNLGVEGMMSIGACIGFMVGYYTDNFVFALFFAALSGALSALIYAFLTVTLMANQNVTGLTLTIFGIGFANFIGIFVLNKSPEGTLKLPEKITAAMRGIHIPGLSDLPIVGELLFSYSPFVYIGILIAGFCGYYLNRTKMGLGLKAVGENPGAADAAGIGGVYCSMIINGGVWISDNVGGLGWIAVALVIFANWQPSAAILGSFVFGALRVLKYYIPQSIFPFPIAFYDMLPFLMTALVLVISSMRKSSRINLPAALGLNYFREER